MDLTSIMCGLALGRSVVGAQRVIGRWRSEHSPEGQEDAQLLTNYLKIVALTVEFLGPDKVMNASSEDVKCALLSLVRSSEKFEFPLITRKALLQRHMMGMSATDFTTQIIGVISPFVEGDIVFDPFLPTVSSVDASFKIRSGIFSTIAFRDCLASWVGQGEIAKLKVINFALALLVSFQNEDVVEMDAAQAKLHSETISICSGLVAIATDSLDASLEACTLQV